MSTALCTLVILCPFLSCLFGIVLLSVWHCAWDTDFCKLRLACLPVWPDGGTNSRQGSWREQRRYFPTLSFRAQHSGIYWQSFFFQGANVLWVLAPCSLRPGVGKSFSLLLVSGYFITPQFFLSHASTSLNSSCTEFSTDSLSKSFLYC